MQETVLNEKKNKKSPTDFLINIFGRVWAVWALISFIISFLIIFIPSMISYLIPGKKGQDYFIWVSRCWMRIWLYIIGCPLSVKGKENFTKGQTYVIVYNHNALLDVPLSAPFVPGGNKTIAKASFAKVPVFGWFYKRGSVLVDRNDNRSRLKSLEDMREVLRNNLHMCIYPEGTRNRTQEPLKPFYDGAFKLAVDAKKDVIPCVIFGTREAIPINKGVYLIPTRLRMHFLPPVSSAGMKSTELKNTVFEIMKEYYISDGKKSTH
ncbi:MAG: 1-acyl-sn-glycerol-3-phosphate acyltransferase [Ferruginibacter sp.]|nr:1-acyl-sn-glycerol-3-phosphate acyltransferase [Ferruginibacter sp.]